MIAQSCPLSEGPPNSARSSAAPLGPGGRPGFSRRGFIGRVKYCRAERTSRIRLRPAVPADAPAIGAVFDAAVRAGWTYLGELVAEPMFTSGDWDQLVADHVAPNVLVVAVDETGRVVGYTAAHPADCEMFLLFVHPAYAGRGIGRSLLTAAHDALSAAGCAEAFLFVHEENE